MKNELLVWYAVLIITGIGVGFASGLLGVGGCFIMIPVQYWVYTSMGLSPKLAILTAFGTNLAVVLPTAISGALGHSRKNAVIWKAALLLGITGAIGAFFGSSSATMLPAKVLKIAFGVAILAGAIRMLTAKKAEIGKKPNLSTASLVFWGILLGTATGIIGGRWSTYGTSYGSNPRFGMRRAVGTSTAVMIFTSAGGLIGYIVNGLHANVFGQYPVGYMIGYFNLDSWLALAATSVPMAQVGVKVAHILHPKKLKYIFAAVMVYMALKMIGVC